MNLNSTALAALTSMVLELEDQLELERDHSHYINLQPNGALDLANEKIADQDKEITELEAALEKELDNGDKAVKEIERLRDMARKSQHGEYCADKESQRLEAELDKERDRVRFAGAKLVELRAIMEKQEGDIFKLATKLDLAEGKRKLVNHRANEQAQRVEDLEADLAKSLDWGNKQQQRIEAIHLDKQGLEGALREESRILEARTKTMTNTINSLSAARDYQENQAGISSKSAKTYRKLLSKMQGRRDNWRRRTDRARWELARARQIRRIERIAWERPEIPF